MAALSVEAACRAAALSRALRGAWRVPRLSVRKIKGRWKKSYHKRTEKKHDYHRCPVSPCQHRFLSPGTYKLLILTNARYQSTVTTADSQIGSQIYPWIKKFPHNDPETVLPLPLPDVPPTFSEALGQVEQSLSELGLGASTPVGMVQNFLEFLHVGVGLPWWGAIVTGTVIARVLVFPLMAKGLREAAKLNNHMPQINAFTTRMNEAKQSGNKFEFSKAYSDLTLYQKKHDVNPLRGFLVPLVQAPVFISFFMALRQMSYLPVPSLQTGGLWWFTDLTAADPFYILPVFVTCTMWAVLELGAESGVNNPNLRIMKTVFRVMPLVILPLTMNFPTAVFMYWVTSNIFSLAQVSFLRIPYVRNKLRIPERIKHDPSSLPQQEGFLKSLKSGWKNAQVAQQLQERERKIKNHLDIAAKGPLRPTFSQNPLQQQETAVSPKKNKSKPWQDTIG
ncbi:mitochondrial inner membrane OXA1L-like [Pelobates cultripes]|uniref:Mitochondrial inner membrane OXA1L-like n=1 Tax=Pelobates cultripes TaxID=61616 RepID=A0AAD1SCV1_PELCU|nr:mitochondrial inner membrane OXA1L-like [Pelobates cultripes]